MVETIPLSIVIVEWNLGCDESDNAAQEIEDLVRAGYSIIQSGAAAGVGQFHATAYVIMSTRKDL